MSTKDICMLYTFCPVTVSQIFSAEGLLQLVGVVKVSNYSRQVYIIRFMIIEYEMNFHFFP